ncbi:MAG: hypothetical protein ACI9UO_002142, partial [Nitrospinales bacterium]
VSSLKLSRIKNLIEGNYDECAKRT